VSLGEIAKLSSESGLSKRVDFTAEDGFEVADRLVLDFKFGPFILEMDNLTDLQAFSMTKMSAGVHCARRMFRANQRYLGQGPLGMKEGDIICVLAGHRAPVIL
jgi:hypothetical protein